MNRVLVFAPLWIASILLWVAAPQTIAESRNDVPVASFEGDDYGDWQVQGDAFGTGPAKGTLPGQMQVTGYQGQGLVNSYHQGDDATGTLTSPAFRIERNYIQFLIGGGGYPETTCMNLIRDGEILRTATGTQTRPGGSEELHLQQWDVQDLSGQTVTLQIVDQRTGGWGHLNVDHIVQSDRKSVLATVPGRQTRTLTLTGNYLLIPIQNGARMTPVEVSVGGQNVREFDAELAMSREDVSFWSFLDITAFKGREATLTLSGVTEATLNLIVQSDELPAPDNVYDEALRPQFHFSQRLGWNNDPNGMVFYDGEWHLYFQHNPYGREWGNMHWGHAVSRDLVHWEQLPIALYNHGRGGWAFSGGAIVDEHNSAGWQTGEEQVIVASWTSIGRGECMAYSNDRGRTFTEYEGNPVIRHQGRDPKIIWYEPGQHWVLAVYNESEADGQAIAFHSSTNLKEWRFESKLKGYFECPEIIELPIGLDETDTRWVVFAADARYAIGRFDGKTFIPEHQGKHQLHFGEYYASQVFNNAPDGRHIQIGWARIPMPGMPFNQTFSFPHRLTLRDTEDGVRLFAEPVNEIETLHETTHKTDNRTLQPDRSVDLGVSGELFDIRATFELGNAKAVGFDIGGERIVYDVPGQKLNGVGLKPVDGQISMQILVDRPMLEICGNHGRVTITSIRRKKGGVSSIQAWSEGGEATLAGFEVNELKSIWGQD